MNSSVFVLYKQYILEKLKSAGFIFTTLFLAGFVVLAFNFSTIINLFMANESTVIGVNQPNATQIHFVNGNNLSFQEGKFINKDIEDEKVDAILNITITADGQLAAEIVSDRSLEQNILMDLNQMLTIQNQQFLGKKLGLTSEQINKLVNTSIEAKNEILDKSHTNKSLEEKMIGKFVSYMLAAIMMSMTMMYAQQLLVNISVEKGTKILDVLFSSVTPRQHIIAKLLATLTLCLLQISSIGLIVYIGLFFTNQLSAFSSVAHITPMFIVISVLYLLGAIVLYTIFGAILGALVTRPDEAQQVAYPLSILMIVGFYATMIGMTNADALWFKVMSHIPFFSSLMMPMRYSSTDMPFNEVVINLVVLYVTCFILFVVAIKLYEKIVFRNDTGNVFKRLLTGYKSQQ